MRALNAEDILVLWEEGATLRPAARALAILSRTLPVPQNRPQEDREQGGKLAGLSVGQRDVRLTAVRRSLFGDRLEIRADCPGCGMAMMLSPDARDLDLVEERPPGGPAELTLDGVGLRLRAVTAGDMVAAEAAPDAEAARRVLLGRCVSVVDGAAGTDPASFAPGMQAAIDQALEALDPQASIVLTADCPDCRAPWRAPFDAGSFLWQELAQLAPRLLTEVAQLALRYPWSEREILAMPAARRRFYLEAAGG